ncbi:unnamed protein product [Symbiodinium sp. CCMP2456]|nr:unnamed protein product [Symbiodinium sp. CCMP2456]
MGSLPFPSEVKDEAEQPFERPAWLQRVAEPFDAIDLSARSRLQEMSKRRDRLTRQLRALQAAQAAFLNVVVHLRSNEQEHTSCNESFWPAVRHVLHLTLAETVS